MERIIVAFVYVQDEQLDACVAAMSPFETSSRSGPMNGRWQLTLRLRRSDLATVQAMTHPYTDRPFSYREECVFSKLELEGAELLAVRVDRRPVDILGVDGGMRYDFKIVSVYENPAPWCWQLTPLLLKRSDLPKALVGLQQTIPMEMIVNTRLLGAVAGLRHKHVRLGPVVASDAATDWLQLMVDRVMPPYDAATTGLKTYRQEYAPSCSPPTVVSKLEEGFWPAYRRAEVIGIYGDIPQIAFTYELEGTWVTDGLARQNAIPQPRLLVDQQTRHELMAAGVKKLEYVPVRWLD